MTKSEMRPGDSLGEVGYDPKSREEEERKRRKNQRETSSEASDQKTLVDTLKEFFGSSDQLKKDLIEAELTSSIAVLIGDGLRESSEESVKGKLNELGQQIAEELAEATDIERLPEIKELTSSERLKEKLATELSGIVDSEQAEELAQKAQKKITQQVETKVKEKQPEINYALKPEDKQKLEELQKDLERNEKKAEVSQANKETKGRTKKTPDEILGNVEGVEPIAIDEDEKPKTVEKKPDEVKVKDVEKPKILEDISEIANGLLSKEDEEKAAALGKLAGKVAKEASFAVAGSLETNQRRTERIRGIVQEVRAAVENQGKEFKQVLDNLADPEMIRMAREAMEKFALETERGGKISEQVRDDILDYDFRVLGQELSVAAGERWVDKEIYVEQRISHREGESEKDQAEALDQAARTTESLRDKTHVRIVKARKELNKTVAETSEKERKILQKVYGEGRGLHFYREVEAFGVREVGGKAMDISKAKALVLGLRGEKGIQEAMGKIDLVKLGINAQALKEAGVFEDFFQAFSQKLGIEKALTFSKITQTPEAVEKLTALSSQLDQKINSLLQSVSDYGDLLRQQKISESKAAPSKAEEAQEIVGAGFRKKYRLQHEIEELSDQQERESNPAIKQEEERKINEKLEAIRQMDPVLEEEFRQKEKEVNQKLKNADLPPLKEQLKRIVAIPEYKLRETIRAMRQAHEEGRLTDASEIGKEAIELIDEINKQFELPEDVASRAFTREWLLRHYSSELTEAFSYFRKEFPSYASVEEQRRHMRKWLRMLFTVASLPESSVRDDIRYWIGKVDPSVRDEFYSRFWWDKYRRTLESGGTWETSMGAASMISSSFLKTALSVPGVREAYNLWIEKFDEYEAMSSPNARSNFLSELALQLVERIYDSEQGDGAFAALDFSQEENKRLRDELVSEALVNIEEARGMFFFMDKSDGGWKKVIDELRNAHKYERKTGRSVVEERTLGRNFYRYWDSQKGEWRDIGNLKLGYGAESYYNMLFNNLQFARKVEKDGEQRIKREGNLYVLTEKLGFQRTDEKRRIEMIDEEIGEAIVFKKGDTEVWGFVYQDVHGVEQIQVVNVVNENAQIIAEAHGYVSDSFAPTRILSYYNKIAGLRKTILDNIKMLSSPPGAEFGHVQRQEVLENIAALVESVQHLDELISEQSTNPKYKRIVGKFYKEDLLYAYGKGFIDLALSPEGKNFSGYFLFPRSTAAIIANELRNNGGITEDQYKKLMKRIGGSPWYVKNVLMPMDIYTAVFRHPLMRLNLIIGTLSEFFGRLLTFITSSDGGSKRR